MSFAPPPPQPVVGLPPPPPPPPPTQQFPQPTGSNSTTFGIPPPIIPPPYSTITAPLHYVAPPPSIVSSVSRPNQLLFTHIPQFLHNIKTIRDWIMSVGGTRSVLFVPPPPKSGGVNVTSITSLNIKPYESITALATMSNPDIAVRVLNAFRLMATTYLKDHEDMSLRDFNVQPVPTNPDVPMPPISSIDIESDQIASEKMYQALLRCKHGDDVVVGAGITPGSVSVDHTNDGEKNNGTNGGAGEDDNVDPLETPEVLEAVRKFREHLAVLQGSKATKRQKLVADAIDKEIPIMRQRLIDERAAAAAAPIVHNIAPGSLLPPPPPPPPPFGVTAPIPQASVPPLTTLEEPLGISSTPTWVSENGKRLQQSDALSVIQAPPSKKIKLDNDSLDHSICFPNIPPQSHILLRQYISDKIQQYLGVEEVSLIDFVYNNVVQQSQKTVTSLLPELIEVLDEDAIPFLQSIYDFSQQLTGNS